MSSHDDPILNCGCGRDHETMPMDEEDGVLYPLVCREHKRHEPCRRCLYADEEFLAFLAERKRRNGP